LFQVKNELKDFYNTNVNNSPNEPLINLYAKDVKHRGIESIKDIAEAIKTSPDGVKALAKKQLKSLAMVKLRLSLTMAQN